MILIDALNIKSSGGVVLLEYLVKTLRSKDVEFHLLDHKTIANYTQSKNPFFQYRLRKKILKEMLAKHDPETLLCFGNFPPPFKVGENRRVITYLQNALVLDSKGIKNFSMPQQVKFVYKQRYFRKNLKHTDLMIVQTELMKKRFAMLYPDFPKDHLHVYPFYNDEKIKKSITNQEREVFSFIFPSSPQKHKNHKVLFDAWKLLNQKGIFPKLTVTIPENQESREILSLIDELNGIKKQIHNIDYVTPEVLFHEITKNEFMIFPSLDETIGLSLVEGVLLGCKVLVSDLAYYKPVIQPSLVFDPRSPKDIAQKIISCQEQKIENSHLVLHNKIDKLISCLIEN